MINVNKEEIKTLMIAKKYILIDMVVQQQIWLLIPVVRSYQERTALIAADPKTDAEKAELKMLKIDDGIYKINETRYMELKTGSDVGAADTELYKNQCR